MTKATATSTAVLALLVSSATLVAHHSLVRFDVSAPIWLTGTVVRFELVNPHGRIYVDVTGSDGTVEQWMVDGPMPTRFARMGIGSDIAKAGDVVRICGFTLKDESGRVPGKPRFINGTVMAMADGQKVILSDYGQLHQCPALARRASPSAGSLPPRAQLD